MEKVLKIIITVFLIVITTVSIFAFTVLDTTEKFVSKENIVDTIKKIDIKKVLTGEIKDKIYETIENSGIPEQYIDYMLDNEELKENLGNYMYESVDNLLNGKKIPKLKIKETTNTLINSFKQVSSQVNNNNINLEDKLSIVEQEKIINKLEESATKLEKVLEDNLINEINKGVDEATESLANSMVKIKSLSYFKNILLVIIIIELIALVLVNIKKLEFTKFIGIPFIINVVMLFIINLLISIVMNNSLKLNHEDIYSVINPVVQNILKMWKNLEIKYMLVFVMSLVASIIISNINQKKNPEEKIYDIETINIEK